MFQTAALVLLLTVGGNDVTLQTLDGQSLDAQLVNITTNNVTVETSGEQKTFERKQLLDLQFSSPSPSPAAKATVWIELADGSRFSGTGYSVTQGQGKFSDLNKQSIAVAQRAVKVVKFRQHEGQLAEQWAQIRKTDTASDILVIKKGESIDFLEGIVSDISPTTINFDPGGGNIPVKKEKVDSIIYATPATLKLGELAGVVYAGDSSSVVQAQSLKQTDGSLQLITRSGATLSLPLRSVQRIDYSAGKILYLSGIEPESVRWDPYFGLPESLDSLAAYGVPSRNRSLEGGPLLLYETTSDGQQIKQKYTNGVAFRSRTESVYRLPDRYRRFQAIVGIDGRVRQRGNVLLTIFGDDKQLLQTTIDGMDNPQPIELEVQGVNRLRILVDYGKNFDIGDHLNICNARFSK